MKEPESMDELVYFTNRTLGDSGHIRAWAHKATCPECGKGLMGKPKEKGKVKIRATEYVCEKCGHTESKPEHEDKLTMEVIYTCPFCGNQGEATTPYKRKSFEGVQAYIFSCGKCAKKIGITKKMKEGKKKGAVPLDDDD